MDASVYDALIHLGQYWKMRYPLVYVHGNVGNILGDGPAAARYTECRLSNCGQLMLEDIAKRPVNFRRNYDDTLDEPVLLPSIFPNTLCNGSLGIAVGLSANLVPHNATEVCNGIIAYVNNPNITIDELLKIIPGPDFPMGGAIIDGEKIKNIYATGKGSITVQSHYQIGKNGRLDEIVFTDLPYQVEIETGVIKPLKKLVTEDGYEDVFEDYQDNTDDKHVEFHVILKKGVNIDSALAILFNKTKLEQNIKINNTVLVQGEPRTLSLIEMIKEYVRHRNNCIVNVAHIDLEKAQHKQTVVIGLQKCMSNIDRVITLIRNADSRDVAKIGLKTQFELNDEQADAVLDMKLSRLSRLDIQDLQQQSTKLLAEIDKQNAIINDQAVRNQIIIQQLQDMKQQVGDKRRTEIRYDADSAEADEKPQPLREFFAYSDRVSDIIPPTYGAVGCLFDTSAKHLFVYSRDGTIAPVASGKNNIGVGQITNEWLITVTKHGYIKKTAMSDVWRDKATKGLKLKAEDELLYANTANSGDSLILLGKNGALSRLPIDDMTPAGKLTQGLMNGLGEIQSAAVGTDNDVLAFIDNENKGKLVSIADLSVNSRTSKGQKINDGVRWILNVKGRSTIYAVIKQKVIALSIDKKFALKSKTASGAILMGRSIDKIF